MVVREGANVTLQCAATGFPTPKITWRREDKQKISFDDNFGRNGVWCTIMGRKVKYLNAILISVESREGPFFNLSKVNRLHMGESHYHLFNSICSSID
jgi:hypothetical protein